MNKNETPLSAEALAAAMQSNGNQAHVVVQKPKATKKQAPAAQQQTTTVTVVPPAVSVAAPPVNLLDRILAKRGAGQEVAQAVQMANAILANAGAVETFAEAMKAADELAKNKLGFDVVEGEAMAGWDEFDLPQVETRLNEWSRGDSAAQTILETIATFRQSTVDVVTPLWRLYAEIVRPANRVRSYFHMGQLMKRLYDNRLVEKIVNARHYPAKAVVLGDQHHSSGYLPAMENGRPVPMAEAGWFFIQQAKERCENWALAQRERLRELAEKADGLTPAQALEGKEGMVFVQSGPNSGALLHIAENRVRVEEAIGMIRRRTGWMPLESKNWSREVQIQTGDLYRSFDRWLSSTPKPAQAEKTPAQPAE